MAVGGTPPGWYPDPWQGGGLRWWDGTTWTGHAAAQAPGEMVDLDEEEARGRRAKIAILASIPLLVASSAGIVAVVRWFVDHIDEFDTQTGTLDTSGLGWRQALLYVGSPGHLVAGIFFLIWFYRAALNARALGLPARREPGLATGGFLIPIVNLWWPFQSTIDLYPPGQAPRSRVMRWWLLWVLGIGLADIVVAIAAVISPVLGYATVVIPAAALTAAALTAGQVIDDVGATHRHLATAGVPRY